MELLKKYFSIILFAVFLTSFFGLTGCAETQPKEKIIIKKVYIKQQKPKLETINIKDLNLSKDEPINLHIKIIKGSKNEK